MNLYSQQSKNITKTWVLMTVFAGLIIGLGFFVAQMYNNPSILYVFVAFGVGMNIFSYWFSDSIALAINGAKEADRKTFFDLYTTVENLSITAGLPMPKVYVINDSAPNAFATGRDPKHSVVAVTTGLLAILDKSELEGVIAHELSHIGNRDILIGTVAVVLVGMVSIISDLLLRMGLWGGHRDSDREGSNNALFLILGIVVAILAPIAATLIQLAISRKREYLADASGALLTRYPEGLARALEKIGGASRPMTHANTSTAHLFIANPFGKHGKASLSNLFATHPPIADRIRALRGEVE